MGRNGRQHSQSPASAAPSLPIPTPTENQKAQIYACGPGIFYQSNNSWRDIAQEPYDSSSHCRGRKRKRTDEEPEETSIKQWLGSLPRGVHDFDMSQQAPKRLRSQSRDSITTATSEIGPESTVSRESKYSIYQEARYPALLESQGSHMGESASGLLADELAACESLFTSAVTLPSEPLLNEGRFRRFLGVLENKSELRVCIDLHPRLVPSAELLSLHSEGPFGDIVDGYNDRWTKAMVFYKKLPQPDRTVAFRESALTDEQRSKLAILPEVNSLFSVREGMCFPFLTCEVKCGKQALELADRSNANSMTIATRARVELYRRAGRLADIHRRVSGFSISHDDKSVRIYAHYAEVFGERPLYYRYLLRAFDCRDKNGQDRWTTYQFVINVYTHFAPQHLKNLRSIIDEIPSPMMRSMDSTVTANDLPGDSDSQEIQVQRRLLSKVTASLDQSPSEDGRL